MSERIMPAEGPMAPHRVIPGKKAGKEGKKKEEKRKDAGKRGKRAPSGDDEHLVDRRA